MLTGQTIQLFSERSHDHIILHDVCHLVLQVLLIECDQGIRAGIPNLNERLIISAVYKSMLKCIALYLYIYIDVQECRFTELNTSKLSAAVRGWYCLNQARAARVTSTALAGN